MRTLSLLVLTAAGLAACNPYSPDLGQAPFFCGPPDQMPRCPDGFICKSNSTGSGGTEVCVAPGGAIPVDGQGNCSMDQSLEPNDTIMTAWITPVDSTKTFPLSSLSICPAGDKDNYSIMMTTPNENLELVVMYDAGGAELQAAILNSSGIAISNASPTDPNTKRAYVTNLPTGIYYAQVTGPASGSVTTNNYKLTLTVTGP